MGRYSRLREIRRMDPARDCAEILRLMSQYEFPWDYRQGISVAFLRDYGVPRISVLLDRTQEFERNGQKRYDDTVLFGYEMAAEGFDSERARAAARHLNRIHGKYRIPNEDYLYVLATTVVGPKRWIDRFGWRPLCEQETAALAEVGRRMAAMMGIEGAPATYAGFEALLDSYEARMFAYDPANRRVANATFRVMAAWYPAPLRPWSRDSRSPCWTNRCCGRSASPHSPGGHGRRRHGSYAHARTGYACSPPGHAGYLPGLGPAATPSATGSTTSVRTGRRAVHWNPCPWRRRDPPEPESTRDGAERGSCPAEVARKDPRHHTPASRASSARAEQRYQVAPGEGAHLFVVVQLETAHRVEEEGDGDPHHQFGDGGRVRLRAALGALSMTQPVGQIITHREEGGPALQREEGKQRLRLQPQQTPDQRVFANVLEHGHEGRRRAGPRWSAATPRPRRRPPRSAGTRGADTRRPDCPCCRSGGTRSRARPWPAWPRRRRSNDAARTSRTARVRHPGSVRSARRKVGCRRAPWPAGSRRRSVSPWALPVRGCASTLPTAQQGYPACFPEPQVPHPCVRIDPDELRGQRRDRATTKPSPQPPRSPQRWTMSDPAARTWRGPLSQQW